MSVESVKFTLNGQSYSLTLDSSTGKYKATITAPTVTSWNETDHKYQGTVTATDDAGNSTTATVSDFSALGLRVLEKVAPAISMTYPTASAFITSAKPTFKWTVTDNGSGIDKDTISIKIDGGTAITSGITAAATTNGYTCEYTPASALDEGAHTVYFNVSDNDGNAATQASTTFTIDTVPPTLNITSPAEGLITNKAALKISGTTNDSTSSPVKVTVQVGSGTVQSAEVASDGSWSIDVTLAEGENTIKIVATDSAGKSTTIQRTVTLDTGAPVISAVELTPNPVDAGETYIITVTVTDA